MSDVYLHRLPEKNENPFVFSSPHSGRYYPAEFLELSCLNEHDIRRSEDCYVDQLFSHVAQSGSHFLAGLYPRAYVDLNRAPYELDPSMFIETLPDHAQSQTLHVLSGLGTIARIVARNKEIYPSRIPLKPALQRIEQIYKPYHRKLQQLLDHNKACFGYACLIDCHSMPGNMRQFVGSQQPDIILGDCYGRSCTPILKTIAYDILTSLGYYVALNEPFSGGYITTHYGQPQKQIHALQIEINRSLYMEETTYQQHQGFAAMQADLQYFTNKMIADFADFDDVAMAAQ